MCDWSLVKDSLMQFYVDERGSEVIEWTLITVVMVGASAVVLRGIQAELGRVFVNILNRLLEP
jgi:Flp pilus assembly pilin Flp